MQSTPNARHSVSVAAVILSEDGSEVLLIRRRDNSRWEPPGGVLELGESILDGLRREVGEETGVTVTVEALSGVYKNMTRGIVALVYRCRADSLPLTESPEASSITWQPVASVSTLMPPAYAIRVLDALQLDAPATRSHDGLSLRD